MKEQGHQGTEVEGQCVDCGATGLSCMCCSEEKVFLTLEVSGEAKRKRGTTVAAAHLNSCTAGRQSEFQGR